MGLDSSQGHGLMSRKLNWSSVPSPYAQLWKELAFEFHLSASAHFKTSSFLPSSCRVGMLRYVPDASDCTLPHIYNKNLLFIYTFEWSCPHFVY